VSYGVAAVLAAQRGLSRRARAVAVPLVAVALLVVTGAEYVRAPLHPRAVPPAPPVYTWLAKQPVGPTIELPLGSPPSELNREQVRQYWSTIHWQPRLNGSSDLQPYAFTALRRDLDAFPNPRTLGILQGLGVRYVILHRAQYPRAEWDRLAAAYNSYRVTLQPRGQFGDDFAYELQPDDRFAALRKTIAPGADVFLSGNDPDVSDTDPNGSDAYMAMVGYLLRDHRLITRIVPTFGQRYTRPEPGKLAAYAIVYKTESPMRYNYPAGMPVVYEDNVVRVYRRPGK